MLQSLHFCDIKNLRLCVNFVICSTSANLCQSPYLIRNIFPLSIKCYKGNCDILLTRIWYFNIVFSIHCALFENTNDPVKCNLCRSSFLLYWVYLVAGLHTLLHTRSQVQVPSLDVYTCASTLCGSKSKRVHFYAEGITLQANLRNSLHIGNEVIQPSFETQSRYHHQCKTGVSVLP